MTDRSPSGRSSPGPHERSAERDVPMTPDTTGRAQAEAEAEREDQGQQEAEDGARREAEDEAEEEDTARDGAPPGSGGDHGPDPLRFSRWMKGSATGAVLTGVTLGLHQALAERERPAYVVEAPGEPDDDSSVHLRFDPDDPTKTVAVVRVRGGTARSSLSAGPDARPAADDPGG